MSKKNNSDEKDEIRRKIGSQKKLREIAEILHQDTSSEDLETFETIKLSVRKHLLETIAPEIGNFL